jgi:hypothetical protein
MPMLITDWLAEVGAAHTAKTQASDKWITSTISQAFADSGRARLSLRNAQPS